MAVLRKIGMKHEELKNDFAIPLAAFD